MLRFAFSYASADFWYFLISLSSCVHKYSSLLMNGWVLLCLHVCPAAGAGGEREAREAVAGPCGPSRNRGRRVSGRV
jgi:hypothetical protein